jgi:hypothetical protein
MSKTMVTPFDSCHIGLMNLSDEARSGMDAGSVEKLSALASIDLCKTVSVFENGAPVVLGVVAAVPVEPKGCEVLVISTEDQKRYPFAFAKGVRSALATIRPHFVNIQTIGEDTPFYARWFSWLGFSCEGSIVRPEFGGTRMMMWELR